MLRMPIGRLFSGPFNGRAYFTRLRVRYNVTMLRHMALILVACLAAVGCTSTASPDNQATVPAAVTAAVPTATLSPTPAPPISPVPIANFGDTLAIEGQSGLNITLLSWQESDWVVNGPYVFGYYTFNAKPGMKFINVQFRFTNVGVGEQLTPSLKAGELAIAPQGSPYQLWLPLGGINAEAYNPRPSTDDEIKALGGDEAAYETLLPGESVTGRLIFEVPENVVPIEAQVPGLAVPFTFASGATIAPTLTPLSTLMPLPTASVADMAGRHSADDN